jgi:hypothetical protein
MWISPSKETRGRERILLRLGRVRRAVTALLAHELVEGLSAFEARMT